MAVDHLHFNSLMVFVTFAINVPICLNEDKQYSDSQILLTNRREEKLSKETFSVSYTGNEKNKYRKNYSSLIFGALMIPSDLWSW